jgi:predicted ferric reductase
MTVCVCVCVYVNISCKFINLVTQTTHVYHKRIIHYTNYNSLDTVHITCICIYPYNYNSGTFAHVHVLKDE